jgi:hypothetical protein
MFHAFCILLDIGGFSWTIVKVVRIPFEECRSLVGICAVLTPSNPTGNFIRDTKIELLPLKIVPQML